MYYSVARSIERNPKKLFIVDGIGALISASMLGLVIPKYQSFFGFPSSMLFYLAIIPLFFVVYDVVSYKSKDLHTGNYLFGIALLNIFYCCLSLGFAFYFKETITTLGWSYIILEVCVVALLVFLELKEGAKLRKLNCI